MVRYPPNLHLDDTFFHRFRLADNRPTQVELRS